jgi:hypothetical protein
LATARRPAALFPEPPTIRFRPAFRHCPRCGAKLKVHRVRDRFPQTLHLGRFVARETSLRCDQCPDHPVFRSEELETLVGYGRVYGHDVTVHVGEALFQRSRTVAEIVADLRARNVRISPTGIRELAARFVVGLGILHAEAAPRLRELMRLAGGSVLHLDSTCKGASAHLLTGIDEISGLVLLNAKIPAESQAETATFLRTVSERFGPPAAVSCDMSRGFLAALESELPGVPVYLCHFHFLRDLGKDLLGADYAVVRDRLRHHGVKAGLKRLSTSLADTLRADADRLAELCEMAARPEARTPDGADMPYEAALAAFAASVLDAEHEGDGCGFPFDRPHLLFLRQAQTVLEATEAIRLVPHLPDGAARLCDRLTGLLGPMCGDRALCAAADAVEGRACVFDRVRDAMRLAEPGSRTGLNDDGGETPIPTLMEEVDCLCAKIRDDDTLMRDDLIVAMLAQIDARHDLLFAGPIDLQTPNGTRQLQPQRTNNILERFFRRINRAICKRTGRPAAETDINRLPVDVPLVANLDNPRYLEALLDGAPTLAERMSAVDRNLLDDTLDDMRSSRSALDRKLRARMRQRATPLELALLILTTAA